MRKLDHCILWLLHFSPYVCLGVRAVPTIYVHHAPDNASLAGYPHFKWCIMHSKWSFFCTLYYLMAMLMYCNFAHKVTSKIWISLLWLILPSIFVTLLFWEICVLSQKHQIIGCQIKISDIYIFSFQYTLLDEASYICFWDIWVWS